MLKTTPITLRYPRTITNTTGLVDDVVTDSKQQQSCLSTTAVITPSYILAVIPRSKFCQHSLPIAIVSPPITIAFTTPIAIAIITTATRGYEY